MRLPCLGAACVTQQSLSWRGRHSQSAHAAFPLQEGHQQGPKAEISQLAWNPKIPHILATCTTAGTVTVWDLKKQATVLNLSDNQG